MSRDRGNDSNVQPRLTVVPVDVAERPAALDAMGSARILGAPELDRASRDAAERRTEREQPAIAAVEQARADLEQRRSAAARSLEDLVDEQDRILDAADWCARQPALDADGAGQIASSTTTIDEHSRVVREATRRLERVLEQRAAAEAALEEARRELDGLGASGADETGVRRQLEAASGELQRVNAEYQELMKEAARREAVVRQLEDSLASAAPVVDDDRDQLRSIRAAVNAKFAAGSEGPAASAEDLEHAREAASAATTAAEEAAFRLSKARQRRKSLENELTVRTEDGSQLESRREAALELDRQVASVEQRLGEAEAAARAEVDEATRALSRVELSVERLRQEDRDRRRRLTGFVGLVPEDEQAEVEADPVLHAEVIAVALREHAQAMQPDIDHVTRTIEQLVTELDERGADLDQRRRRLGTVLPEDRRAAVRDLLRDSDVPVVFDGAVSASLDEAALSVADLEILDLPSPVVVLTDDPAVIGWAIELPGDIGRVTNTAGLAAIRPERTAVTVPETLDHRTEAQRHNL